MINSSYVSKYKIDKIRSNSIKYIIQLEKKGYEQVLFISHIDGKRKLQSDANGRKVDDSLVKVISMIQ